jgi:hypothetical protein
MPARVRTPPRELLTARLRGLEAHAERIERLTQKVSGLLSRLEDTSMPDPDQFMTTLPAWPADRMRDLVGYLERARQA